MEKYKSIESETKDKNDSKYDEANKRYDVFTGEEIVEEPDKNE